MGIALIFSALVPFITACRAPLEVAPAVAPVERDELADRFPLMALSKDAALSDKMRAAGFELAGGRLVASLERTRLVLEHHEDHGAILSYEVKDDSGRWIETVRSLGERMAFRSRNDTRQEAVIPFQEIELEPFRIRLIGRSDRLLLEKTIDLERDAGLFCIHVKASFSRPTDLQSFESLYRYVAGTPDFVWTPALKPQPADLMAEYSFRSPAVILQSGGLCSSLVPDVEQIDSRSWALDLECLAEPVFSYGLARWLVRGRTYFQRDVAGFEKTNNVGYGYHLLLQGDAPCREGFRRTVRFMWDRYGHRGLEGIREEEGNSFEDWESEAFEKKSAELYAEVDLPGLRGGLIRTERARWTNDMTNEDAWFSAWYQSIRTACGMFIYSRMRSSPEIEARAASILDLALSAPQKQGIFPTIFCLDEGGLSGRWLTDSGWAGYADCYHALDCSWTGCWLIEAAGLRPDYRATIVRYLRPYADFLIRNQKQDGSIPSFYDAYTLDPRMDLSPHFSAETGASALFLARMYNLESDVRYLDAAQVALEYITDHVLPKRKWQDFETFLAYSRKPFDFFDTITRQYPQSTLNMLLSASAYLELYRITRKTAFLDTGSTIVDYLSLYQQVWSPPFFDRRLFGGIGVQNTDTEWSDARGGYAAEIYFDYHEATGKREYMERGLAALHASFAVLPHENWGRNASNEPGNRATFHWGLGSAAAGSAMIRSDLGDILVDLENASFFSLDGLELQNLMIDKSRISFDLNMGSSRHGQARVKFKGMKYGVYRLIVNGRVLGTKAASELRSGIQVPPDGG